VKKNTKCEVPSPLPTQAQALRKNNYVGILSNEQLIYHVAVNSTQFKLAAMDLDGTLLGPDHSISEANARAVRRLQAAGAQVVLASGRHYNSMLKYVKALPGVQWVVSCQGGEVSDAARTTVLSRRFLQPAEVAALTDTGRTRGFSTVGYTVEGVFTDSTSDLEMDFYTDLAGHRPVVLPRNELLARDIFKVIWMGEPAGLSQVAPADVTLPRVQAVRTNTRFLEFMPADVSKGSALATLALHLGIQPAAVVTFGDGENDVPMFEWAGMSVAMAHGWPLARARAKLVTPDGSPETALARGVDLIFQ
jgi:Cof subfamily protein (haloacid dehalogenase superfamily)